VMPIALVIESVMCGLQLYPTKTRTNKVPRQLEQSVDDALQLLTFFSLFFGGMNRLIRLLWAFYARTYEQCTREMSKVGEHFFPR